MGDPQYIPGNYWMICDRCGFKTRRSDMRKTWDNLWVCKDDWEPRHPQDFVKAKYDRQRVPVARTEPENYFVSDNENTADDL